MAQLSEYRVLAVDDNNQWQRTLGASLEGLGVEYDIVGDGAEAIARLEDEEYAAVVTGGLNGGWQGVAEVAQEQGVQAVILLSASSIAVSAAYREGVSAHHKSGLNTESLRLIITNTLARLE